MLRGGERWNGMKGITTLERVGPWCLRVRVLEKINNLLFLLVELSVGNNPTLQIIVGLSESVA